MVLWFASLTSMLVMARSPFPYSPLLVKDLVNERDGDGTLADGRCDALHVAAAHVTNREHAGQAGLEEVRAARQRPTCRRQVVVGQIRARLDESLLVHRQAVLQPRRVGNGARQH